LREKTGIIQSDISIGNLMMNEEQGNSSWESFLIDLDLGVREQREIPSGAPNKTGTRAFMAIGALYGEKRTFMHDLESFFWVLFWICIHYTGPNGDGRVVAEFESWNYEYSSKLAKIKSGTVNEERHFVKTITEYFTPYFRPLIPWVNRLRKRVFPDGKTHEKDDQELYSHMREILRKAMEDPDVKADWIG
jgi:hypothetical protein